MGLKDFLTDTVLRMDLLSTSPTFRTRKQASYETLMGGLFSFLLMGVFIYFLYMQLSDMLQQLTITYSSGLQDDITSSSSITQFPVALSIDGIDLAVNPKKFIIKLTQTKIVATAGAPTVTTRNIALSPCTQASWSSLGSNFKSQFNAFGFGQMLCIDSAESIALSGYEGSDTYEYLTLNIGQCNQTQDANCDTTANINSYMTTHQNANDYFKVRFFVVDSIITPTNSDAVTYILEKNIFMAFSTTMGTVGYINMGQFELVTDTNLLPFNSYESQKGTYIQKFVSNAVSLSTTRYVKFDVFRSTKSLSISRTIGKIDVILSYVGGLFSLLFTGIAFFLGSYSEYKYELYVAETLLSTDQGKRVTADHLTPFNYFFYCCYDWMDTFGIAPTCFTSLKDIHQVRQESCQQPDPAIVLRRIKYLQDVSKVLLTEHREMCLYLAEPLTLQQAKRMRTTIVHYDQIVQQLQEVQGEERLASSEDEKGVPNAIHNQFQLESAKEPPKEPELTEEEEKKLLDNMIYSSVERLEKDNDEIADKIKKRIPTKTRQWVRENKKYRQNIELSAGTKEVQVGSPSYFSPPEESFQRMNMMKEGKDKSRISIKRARR